MRVDLMQNAGADRAWRSIRHQTAASVAAVLCGAMRAVRV
jgi:hypothetical protein